MIRSHASGLRQPGGAWLRCEWAKLPPEQIDAWRGLLAGERHQVRAEVTVRQVAVPGGSAHEPEGAGDLDVVVGVTRSAVVVDIEGEPDLTGIAEHELAVGVIKAGAAGGEDGNRDGAVAVVDDGLVPPVFRLPSQL